MRGLDITGLACYLQIMPLRNTESLDAANPVVAATWHPTRNADLTPSGVSRASHKRVWWLCPAEPDHEWEATVAGRQVGGCPFCSGRNPSTGHNLAITSPQIAATWHPTRNGDRTPRDVTPHASLRVWWLCPKGHSWRTTIAHRTAGTGCPRCVDGSYRATEPVAVTHPEVAARWHPTRNGSLSPEAITHGSNVRVWWQCPDGPDHEWVQSVKQRCRTGCPFCAGRKVSVLNSLATVSPDLAKLWHPTANGTLTPTQVTAFSTKRVWWKCPHGTDHEWESRIQTNQTSGCPFCAGKRACSTNNLALSDPELAATWHPRRNGNLTPNDVLRFSTRKVWWKCSRSLDHDWQSCVHTRQHQSCPTCTSEGRETRGI